jgi:hypothetical protein
LRRPSRQRGASARNAVQRNPAAPRPLLRRCLPNTHAHARGRVCMCSAVLRCYRGARRHTPSPRTRSRRACPPSHARVRERSNATMRRATGRLTCHQRGESGDATRTQLFWGVTAARASTHTIPDTRAHKLLPPAPWVACSGGMGGVGWLGGMGDVVAWWHRWHGWHHPAAAHAQPTRSRRASPHPAPPPPYDAHRARAHQRPRVTRSGGASASQR